jgi:3-oxoacyl-[acyl-carrier-protein] synthase III
MPAPPAGPATSPDTIGIPAISYVLPGEPVPLDVLAREGKLEHPVEVLQQFGFGSAHISDVPADALALEALQRLCTDARIDPDTIDALFYAGALPPSHCVATGGALQGFSYPVSRLQYECGFTSAITVGIGQAGCTGLMAAVDLAAAHLRTHPDARRAVCVSADVLGPETKREIIVNVISDGACAVLIERGAARNRLLASRRISKGYYWDASGRSNEIIAAYFPTAINIIRDTLASRGMTAADVQLLIPHNVSRRSWNILMPLIGVPPERLFADNIGRKGHVIAADNFINLKDAIDGGRLNAGDRALLFNFGFGATWAAVILEG